MEVYFKISLIIMSIILTALVLLQSRGGGAGSMFGGDGGVYHTRRGMEKTLYNFTILVSAMFLTVSLLTVLIGSR